MLSEATISDEELHSLTQAILRRYGIDFTCYEPVSLKRRVMRAIAVLKLESIHNLWIKLLKERDFIYLFIDELSVGLTAMFRDPKLWQALKKDGIRAIPPKPQLKIWHAGCSSGEEVFSMGILLKEMGLSTKAKALASDMSEAALKQAREGCYHTLKIAEYEKNYKKYNETGIFSRYYSMEENMGKMNEELVKHVDFAVHNLITDDIKDQYDIIFCRNVMIYFDHNAKVKLLDQIYQHLNPGGLFIIGFYDALVPLIDKSRFNFFNLDAKIFQKI